MISCSPIRLIVEKFEILEAKLEILESKAEILEAKLEIYYGNMMRHGSGNKRLLVGGWERCNREIKNFLRCEWVREPVLPLSLGLTVPTNPAAAPPRVFPQSFLKFCESF